MRKKIPDRVFKYRAFSSLTLETLIEDRLFFADPVTFNDPLDTSPAVDVDIGDNELECILRKLIEQRNTLEMTTAAISIHYKGTRTTEHINRIAQKRASDQIAYLKYHSNNPEYDGDPLKEFLRQDIELELRRRYDKGVVAFATSATCPLMWSHYGDQHRGISIGYSVPKDASAALHEIDYGGGRMVRASTIAAMLDGDDAARREVDKVVLLTKADSWRYENEWRLIGNRGAHDSRLEIEEIVFGMRCSLAVQYAVVKALEDRSSEVKLYEVKQQPSSFILDKQLLETGELLALLPRRGRDAFEAFKDLPEPRTGKT